MRSSRFRDEQTIGTIKEQETGKPTAEVRQKHGISGSRYIQHAVFQISTSSTFQQPDESAIHNKILRSCELK